jgi:hypothetical protein
VALTVKKSTLGQRHSLLPFLMPEKNSSLTLKPDRNSLSVFMTLVRNTNQDAFPVSTTPR